MLLSGGAALPPAAKDLRLEADDILKELGIPTGDVPDVAAAAKVKAEPLADDRKPELAEILAPGRRPTSSALGISKITQTSIPPRELVQYSKETQTAVSVAEDGDAGRGAVVDDVDVLSETAQQPEKPAEPESPEKEAAADFMPEKPPTRVMNEDEYRQVGVPLFFK